MNIIIGNSATTGKRNERHTTRANAHGCWGGGKGESEREKENTEIAAAEKEAWQKAEKNGDDNIPNQQIRKMKYKRQDDSNLAITAKRPACWRTLTYVYPPTQRGLPTRSNEEEKKKNGWKKKQSYQKDLKLKPHITWNTWRKWTKDS